MISKKGYKLLYDEKFVMRNLESVYEKCTSKDIQKGKGWYENANLFCSELSSIYSIDIIKVVGIVAALSPMKEWNLNKNMAETFLSSGGLISSHTSQQTEKALAIYKDCKTHRDIERVLNGQKTVNFFNNILYPEDPNYVTIDRHHLAIVSQSKLEYCTPNQYNSVKNITKMFADSVNLLPNQAQSTLWVCWKRIKKHEYGKTKKKD